MQDCPVMTRQPIDTTSSRLRHFALDGVVSAATMTHAGILDLNSGAVLVSAVDKAEPPAAPLCVDRECVATRSVCCSLQLRLDHV